MKHISAKIFSFVASTFLATSAFAWTPTVEVVRDSNNVLLRVGGWTTAAEMNEMDWSTYNVKMMILNQEFDVTAAVVSLFTSGHPSVNFTFNGHFDLNIALNQYFGIPPDQYPIRLNVCKLATAGGECANNENLLLRNPAHSTGNATCYPSPLCATGSGPVAPQSTVSSLNWLTSSYQLTGFEFQNTQTKTITKLRAVTRGYANTGNPWPTHAIVLNIYSSLQMFTQTPIGADVVDQMQGQITTQVLFGSSVSGQIGNSYFMEIELPTPVTLPPGSYIISPHVSNDLLPSIYIRLTTEDLGTDYLMAGSTGLVPIQSFNLPQRTTAVDLIGY